MEGQIRVISLFAPDTPAWLMVLLVVSMLVAGLIAFAGRIAKAYAPPPADRKDFWRTFFEHRRNVTSARRAYHAAKRRARHNQRREKHHERAMRRALKEQGATRRRR